MDERGDGTGESEAPESQPEGERESTFVRVGLYFYGAMIAVALVWRMGFYGESILYAGPEGEHAGIDPLGDVGIGLGVGLAIVLVSHGVTNWTGWGERLARELALALGPISLPNAILLALASGVGEELLFRGALQPRVGLVLASLLFGVVHFVPRRDMLPWTAFAIVTGFMLGALFEWTGNIVAPIVAHAVVNGVNLPYLVNRYGDDQAPEDGA